MMLQSAKRSLLMGTDCFIVLVLIVEGVVLHFYVERVSTYVDCPPVKRLLLSFGLLCSPLLIYFLISSSTLCRQTELNTYGNIVGRRGLEFSRGFAQYIKERSVISIYSSLTRHAFGGFCNSDELWISFARGNLPCERPSFVRVQNTTPEPFVSLWRCGR